MTLTTRDDEALLTAIEGLSRVGREGGNIRTLLERLLGTVEGACCADQSVALVTDPRGREYYAERGEGLGHCQADRLRKRLLEQACPSEVALLGRVYWEQVAEDEQCLGARLRSGILVDLSAGRHRGCLLVAFRADHLFSEREILLLRALGHVAAAAVEKELLRDSLQAPSEWDERAHWQAQARDEERRRVAGELHDGLGQSLTAIKISIERCLLQYDRDGGRVERAGLVSALTGVRDSIEEVRRIVLDKPPGMLKERGLLAALDRLCLDFETGGRFRVRGKFEVNERDVPEGLWAAIYRICQEALSNAARHAEASEVSVNLGWIEGELVLRIADNGRGLNDQRVGFGLTSMRERAEGSGGRFAVEGQAPQGTLVTARWPVIARKARGEALLGRLRHAGVSGMLSRSSADADGSASGLSARS